MAKPDSGPDGSVNLMVWQCIIPGKPGVSSLLLLHTLTPWISWSSKSCIRVHINGFNFPPFFTLLEFPFLIVLILMDVNLTENQIQLFGPQLSSGIVKRIWAGDFMLFNLVLILSKRYRTWVCLKKIVYQLREFSLCSFLCNCDSWAEICNFSLCFLFNLDIISR